MGLVVGEHRGKDPKTFRSRKKLLSKNISPREDLEGYKKLEKGVKATEKQTSLNLTSQQLLLSRSNEPIGVELNTPVHRRSM